MAFDAFDAYGSKPWHPAPSRKTMDLLMGKPHDQEAIAAFKAAYRAELAELGLDPDSGVPYTPYAASVAEHRGQGKDFAFKDGD